MNEPQISICVPVYNVAPYIERCVRSLMGQTYRNTEFVFVDDGSTDQSMAILRSVLAAYPERSKQAVIVTNDRNHGLAYTRRVSIEQAHGEYIVCVDSDDYAERHMVQSLFDQAAATDADIVAAGYYMETATPTIVAPYSCTDGEDYVEAVLTDKLQHLCNKLVRRSLFTEGRSCYAPEGLDYMEDRTTMLLLASKAKHITAVNLPTYHYVYRGDSVSQGKSEKHFRCLIRYWQIADSLIGELGRTEQYKQLVGEQKIHDKAFLLMYCDNSTRKQFADLYSAEEQLYHPQLSRGLALMHWLTKHHLWWLTYGYHCYIRLIARG